MQQMLRWLEAISSLVQEHRAHPPSITRVHCQAPRCCQEQGVHVEEVQQGPEVSDECLPGSLAEKPSPFVHLLPCWRLAALAQQGKCITVGCAQTTLLHCHTTQHGALLSICLMNVGSNNNNDIIPDPNSLYMTDRPVKVLTQKPDDE